MVRWDSGMDGDDLPPDGSMVGKNPRTRFAVFPEPSRISLGHAAALYYYGLNLNRLTGGLLRV